MQLFTLVFLLPFPTACVPTALFSLSDGLLDSHLPRGETHGSITLVGPASPDPGHRDRLTGQQSKNSFLSKGALSSVKSSMALATVGGWDPAFQGGSFYNSEFSIAWDGGINPGSWGGEVICRDYSPEHLPYFRFYFQYKTLWFLGRKVEFEGCG